MPTSRAIRLGEEVKCPLDPYHKAKIIFKRKKTVGVKCGHSHFHILPKGFKRKPTEEIKRDLVILIHVREVEKS